MTIGRRRLLQGGVAAGALGTFSAPLIGRAHAASRNDVLTAVMQGDIRSFDPIASTATITQYFGWLVYDTLFALDANMKPQPEMVEKWNVSEDKLTYTFVLRDGLFWQDGTAVTAADCVASIRRWAARNPGGAMMLASAKDLSAKDDKTFVLALKEPFGLVLTSFASPMAPACLMMRKKDAETDPFQQVKEHVGSGPFMFNEKATRPGNKYVFDKFTKYVPRKEPPSGLAGGKVAKLDQVVWNNIADAQTAVAAIQSGEIDFYELPPLDLLPVLTANPDIKVRVLDPAGAVGFLRTNCLYPPFNNVKARQAMLYLVDQAAVLKAVFGNPKYYNKIDSLFGYDTPMSNDANTAWFKQAPDPAKAKQLFKEAGYKGEPVVVLQPSDFAFMNFAGQLIVSWLKGIGVNARPAVSTWGGVVARRAVMKPPTEGGWSIFSTFTPSFDFGNPITNIQLTANGKKGWFGWPENAAYEALRQKWAVVATDAERLAIAKKMQTLAWDFVPTVLLGQWVSPAAMRKNVHGVLGAPGVIPFWNVSKS